MSRDSEKNTRIMAGSSQFTIDQMEKEIKSNSKLGKKLKLIEKKLK
jgi:putative AlgH/UPF0301 family transcriptional regulator